MYSVSSLIADSYPQPYSTRYSVRKQVPRIAINAKAINNDQTKLSYGDDFNFYKCKTQDQAADIIQRVFCDFVKVHGIENVQILSPNRKKGSAATNQLNPAIRELVNPYNGGLPDLKVGSNFFRVGDKVMQNKNCSKASNGDIGFIRVSTNHFAVIPPLLLGYIPQHYTELSYQTINYLPF